MKSLAAGFLAASFLLSPLARAVDNTPTMSGTPNRANFKVQAWLHPNGHQDLKPGDWNTFFTKLEQWSETNERTDVFQFFMLAIPKFSPAQLKKAVEIFEERGTLVAVEARGLEPETCDAVKDAPVGKRAQVMANASARDFLKQVKPFYDAGGTLSYVGLDGTGLNEALDHLGNPSFCKLDRATAISALVNYMKVIHQTHPEIQFGLLPNFPNANYGGTNCYFNADANSDDCKRYLMGEDYKVLLNDIVAGIRAGGEEVYFVHADNPYDYTIGHAGNVNVWSQRIIPLKQQAESLGLRFGLIINSDLSKSGNPTGDAANAAFAASVQKEINDYLNSGGASQNDVIIESWFPFPNKILPETETNTFMNVANEGFKAYFNHPAVVDYLNVNFPIKGSIDVVGEGTGIIGGWACARQNSDSINVDLFVGASFSDGGKMIGRYLANKSSEPAIASACATDASAYRFSIPASVLDRNGDQGKGVYIHGIHPMHGANALLSGSGDKKVPGPLKAKKAAANAQATQSSGASMAPPSSSASEDAKAAAVPAAEENPLGGLTPDHDALGI